MVDANDKEQQQSEYVASYGHVTRAQTVHQSSSLSHPSRQEGRFNGPGLAAEFRVADFLLDKKSAASSLPV